MIKDWNIKRDALYGFLSVTVVLLTVMGLVSAITRQAALEAERESCETAIHLFLSGSDKLTSEAFAYADTSDMRHLEAYWAEANVTQSRSIAVATLESHSLSDKEKLALEGAVGASSSLMELETHAMRLIAESTDMAQSEMPKAVAEYELHSFEASLSSTAKDLRANELLFGRRYMTQKNAVIRSVDDFSYHLNARFGDAFTRNTQEALSFIAVCLAAFVLFVLLYIKELRRKDAAQREQIRQREECFRIVANQTGRFVFRYDIPTHTYHHITGYNSPVKAVPVIESFVEQALSHNVISEESVVAYRSFFRSIDAGETPPDTDIKLNESGGKVSWYRFSATLAFDSNGKARTAVVSYAECNAQRDRELAYSRWRQEMDALESENVRLYEWNLSRDVLESERGRMKPVDGALRFARFDERAHAYAESSILKDDAAAFCAVMDREKLMGMYHSGHYNSVLDYREVQADGSLRWMRLTVRLVLYPTSSEIKAYIMRQDVNEEKLSELTLIARSELDPLTGAYNRSTFISRVAELIASCAGAPMLMMMLDVDGFKSINDTFGHDFGDKMLQRFTEAARHELRPDDLIGRIGGDEFMICVPNVPSESVMAKKMVQLVHALSFETSCARRATVSIGASVYPKDGVTFEELYKKADIALYKVKTGGKGSFSFYVQDMEEDGNTITGFDE